MKNFDNFELDSNNNRILACGVDERGQEHKKPILLLSEIVLSKNRVIVFDSEIPKFIFEASSEDEAIQKMEELNKFKSKNFRKSPSFFKP